MRDTPRTDEVWEKFETDLRGKFDDAEFYTLARKLERELNAANERIKRLEDIIKHQEKVIKRLEDVEYRLMQERITE